MKVSRMLDKVLLPFVLRKSEGQIGNLLLQGFGFYLWYFQTWMIIHCQRRNALTKRRQFCVVVDSKIWHKEVLHLLVINENGLVRWWENVEFHFGQVVVIHIIDPFNNQIGYIKYSDQELMGIENVKALNWGKLSFESNKCYPPFKKSVAKHWC